MCSLKSILVLSSLGLVAALEPGDCAFVGIYGDHDDFAMVLLEDADGEQIQLTEELPHDGQLKVRSATKAKDTVSSSPRGTVLKRADFNVDSGSLIAPVGLTAFTGSADSPTVLCSINVQSSALQLESFSLNLQSTETAQYAGPTSGKKEDLQEEMFDPSNWLHGTARKLGAFSIAKGVNGTTTMTTIMTTSMQNTTTVMTTITMTTTLTVLEGVATEVTGCLEVEVADVGVLSGSPAAIEALKEAIADGANVTVDLIQELSITEGGCGGARRQRRLQTGATINFKIVFPASLGSAGIAQATAAKSALTKVTPSQFTTTIADKIAAKAATNPELANIVITVTSVPTVMLGQSDESGITKANGAFEFFTNDYAALSSFSMIIAYLTTALATLLMVEAKYIDNVLLSTGACMFRRLADDRRLQDQACLTFRASWAPSKFGGIDEANAAALAQISALSSTSLSGLSYTLTSAVQTTAALENVTIDLVAIDLKITETGVTTTTTTTTMTESYAASTSFGLGLLAIFCRFF